MPQLNRLMISGGVVGVATVLFAAAYLTNGIYQIKTKGFYVPPESLVQMLQVILGAATTVLTIGSLRATNENGKAEIEKRIECTHLPGQCPDGCGPSAK